MAMFIGNKDGKKVVALGTNDSELFSDPPAKSVVFRSDLPYIYTKKYVTSEGREVLEEEAYEQYTRFTLPQEVVLAKQQNKLILYTFIDSAGRRFSNNVVFKIYGYYNNGVGLGRRYAMCSSTGISTNSFGTPSVHRYSSGNGGGVDYRVTLSIGRNPLPGPSDLSIGTIVDDIVAVECLVLESLKIVNGVIVWNNDFLSTSKNPEVYIDNKDIKIDDNSINELGLLCRAVDVTVNSSNSQNTLPSFVKDPLVGMYRAPYDSLEARSYNGAASPQNSVAVGINSSGNSRTFSATAFPFRRGIFNSITRLDPPTATNLVSPVFYTSRGFSGSGVVLDSRTPKISIGGEDVYSPNALALYNIGSSTSFSLPVTSVTVGVVNNPKKVIKLLTVPNVVFGSGVGILAVNGNPKGLYALDGDVYSDSATLEVPAAPSGSSLCALFDLSLGDIHIGCGLMDQSGFTNYQDIAGIAVAYTVFMRKEGSNLVLYAETTVTGWEANLNTYTVAVECHFPGMTLGLSFFNG